MRAHAPASGLILLPSRNSLARRGACHGCGGEAFGQAAGRQAIELPAADRAEIAGAEEDAEFVELAGLT